MTVRTRFAPSPTGFMHIGNLRTGLYAYLFAKKNGGDFILRIEDTDQERYVDGAVELIYRTLEKAGIDYDEGPDKDKGYGPYIQSERKGLYAKYAKELVEKKAAYYCFCDEERLSSLAGDKGFKKYDKHCLSLSKEEIEKRLSRGDPYVIRLNVPHSGEGEYEDMVYGKVTVKYEDMDDCILLKSDGMPTYNFANVVDDHLMNITHVIRGNEYLSSTPMYNLIYDGFGWERPKYMHLAPIMKDETRKLSKRYGDANFEDFIAKGFLPEAIVNYVALLGWCPKDNREKMTMNEMIEAFDVSGISISSSIFDETKMRWLNGEYIKELSDEEFYKLSKPYFDKSTATEYDYKLIAPLLKTRVDVLSDVIEKVAFLADFKAFDKDMFLNKKNKVDFPVAVKALNVAYSALSELNVWDMENIKESLATAAAENDIKGGQVLCCLRLGITGVAVTPGGAYEIAEILGKEETLRRIEFSIALLSDNA
ncbi:MAG: glutamate--tRNA ligase [Christensenellales bacterium]